MTISVRKRGEKSGRETRTFTVEKVEVRAGSGDSSPLTLDGYACVTETPYQIRDFLGEYDEVVRAGSFTRTLKNNADVRLLLNHDGLPLARTKSGTLKLAEDSTGLHVEAQLEPRSGMVNDVRLAMERGDLDEMSFAFEVLQQEWSPDYTQRDIREVRLYDVSVVTYPANPATSASLRQAGIVAKVERIARRSLSDPEKSQVAEILGRVNAVDTVIDEVLEDLAAMLSMTNPDAEEMGEEMDAAARSAALPADQQRPLSLHRAQALSLGL